VSRFDRHRTILQQTSETLASEWVQELLRQDIGKAELQCSAARQLSARLGVEGKRQSKHMVDRFESAASVTSPLDQQNLRRPIFVPSFRADYCRFPHHSGL